MRKVGGILAIVIGIMFFGICNAMAYSVTIVPDQASSIFNWSSSPDNFDRVGDAMFEISKMVVTQDDSLLTFDIYTNLPQTLSAAQQQQVGSWPVFPADLAINVPGGTDFEYGIAFTNRAGFAPGSLYDVHTWRTSNYYDPTAYDRSWQPGSYAPYAYHQGQIVTIANGTFIDDGSVSWLPGADGSQYIIRTSLDINNIVDPGFKGDIGVFYGGATCANDFINGTVPVSNPVPEPATMSLLGIGLVGLLGRKLRKVSY